MQLISLLFNLEHHTMKKIIISAFVLSAALNAGTALAGSCPMDLRQIDSAIETSTLDIATMDQVKALRTQSEALHKSGDHSASVDTLREAKDILGI
jgi:hypothetical protein